MTKIELLGLCGVDNRISAAVNAVSFHFYFGMSAKKLMWLFLGRGCCGVRYVFLGFEGFFGCFFWFLVLFFFLWFGFDFLVLVVVVGCWFWLVVIVSFGGAVGFGSCCFCVVFVLCFCFFLVCFCLVF